MTEGQNKTSYDTSPFTPEMIQKYKKELLELYKHRTVAPGVARPPGPFPPIPPEPEIIAPVFMPRKPVLTREEEAPPVPEVRQPEPPSAPTTPIAEPPAVQPIEVTPLPPPEKQVQVQEQAGCLQLEVTVGKTCIPLENAFITILKEENGRRSVLRFTVTDSCGKTPIIPLEIPIQNTAAGMPRITCIARITAEGYYPVEKLHIPVYAGIKTIQAAEMVALSHFEECVQAPESASGTSL